jgi:hypothetical protein
MEVYSLLSIIHHRSQTSSSTRVEAPSRSQCHCGELPGDLAAIEAAEKRFQQMGDVSVWMAQDDAQPINDHGFTSNNHDDKQADTNEPQLYLRLYKSYLDQHSASAKDDKLSCPFVWLISPSAQVGGGATSALSPQSLSLPDQLRLIAASSMHTAAPYLPPCRSKETSAGTRPSVQQQKPASDQRTTAAPSALDVCLQMRHAALVEASKVTCEETTASVIASYVAILPLALEELHQKATRVSREMLVETGDIASFAVPSSLIDFVLSALQGGVEFSGSPAVAGNTAEEIIPHSALVVMLVEPLMVNNGGSVLRLGGALKRLRYHFRSRDESVEVASAAAAASIHSQVDLAPSSAREESASNDAIDSSDLDGEAPATTKTPSDSDDSEAGAPSTSPSFLSQASPQHMLSYALGLASEDVAQSLENLLDTILEQVGPQAATTNSNLDKHQEGIKTLLASRVAAITGLLYWSTVLSHFASRFQWNQLVDAIVTSKSRTATSSRAGSAADSNKIAHLKRRFIHVCNCLFDLAMQCSTSTTLLHSAKSAAAVFSADFSSVVSPLVLKIMFASKGSSALRLWCQCQVEHLLDVCSDEASSPSLWRREFLIASRRTDVSRIGCGSEQDDANHESSHHHHLAHHALSPVVVKFFRGLSAAVYAIRCLLVVVPDTNIDTSGSTSATGAFYAQSRVVVWKYLVCRGVLSFTSHFDVASSKNLHLIQTSVSDHLDRLYDMLHVASSMASRRSQQGSDGSDGELLSPSDLLAAMFTS